MCYRPPHKNDFYKLFKLSISNISLNSEIIILGDMNTNVDKKNKKCSLIYSMHCFLNIVGVLQLITDATRITPKSSSIIDLIFVSEPDKIQQSGVLPVGFSDVKKLLPYKSEYAAIQWIFCLSTVQPKAK